MKKMTNMLLCKNAYVNSVLLSTLNSLFRVDIKTIISLT